MGEILSWRPQFALGVAFVVWCAATSSAQAVELDFSIETSLEYATDQIMTEEFGNFFSPFLNVDDVRAGAIVTVSATHSFGASRVTGLYSRDQVWHQDFTNLDWNKHTGEISLTSDLDGGSQLWMRYKAKNGRPNGWMGDVDLDIATVRWRLPDLKVNNRSTIFRPFVMAEWESSDFAFVPPLGGEEVTGEFGLQMRSQEGSWSSMAVLSYGQKDTVAERFTHDFVDLEWVHGFDMSEKWRGELDVSYRREWYDGPSADDGRHRFDEEYEAIFSVKRPLSNQVTLKFKFEVEEHMSNRSKADFLETKSKVSLITRF